MEEVGQHVICLAHATLRWTGGWFVFFVLLMMISYDIHSCALEDPVMFRERFWFRCGNVSYRVQAGVAAIKHGGRGGQLTWIAS